MANITTASLNGAPAQSNLGATPLHPQSGGNGGSNSLPPSVGNTGNQNGQLNQGVGNPLQFNVSDPSKYVSNA